MAEHDESESADPEVELKAKGQVWRYFGFSTNEKATILDRKQWAVPSVKKIHAI